MVHKLPFDEFADVELTSAESTHLVALAATKEWDTLVVVMSRWHISKAALLLGPSYPSQDFDLIKRQGGLESFRRMVEFVESATPPAKKK